MLFSISSPVMQAAFKPGTSTWNTDDPEQQPWLARQAKKQKKDPTATVGAAPTPEAGPAALPYTSSAKLVQRQQTTGTIMCLSKSGAAFRQLAALQTTR